MSLVFILVVVAAFAFLFSKKITSFFYKRMEKSDPSPFSSTNFQIAQRFELKRDYDKAIIAYTHLIEEFPDFDAAYISIAEIYKKKKEYDKAVSWLQRLYDRNKNPDILYLICEMYMAQGNDSMVEEVLNRNCRELEEYKPIIESYLKARRNGDSDAYTHLRILAGSDDVKDYIRLKAKRVLGYL